MIKKHRMSVIPKGTLADIVETVFQGRGTVIKIACREYTLREYGTLSEQNLIRIGMLKNLENQVRISPDISHYQKIELDREDKKEQKPTLKIKFTKAEKIPSIKEDNGSHQYMIVEGTRYKVEIEGNLKKIGTTTSQIMQQGRDMIFSCQQGEKLPEEIELNIKIKRGIGYFIYNTLNTIFRKRTE